MCGCVLQAWTLVGHYLSEPVTVESEAVLCVCGCVLQAWTLVGHYLSEPVTVESETVL